MYYYEEDKRPPVPREPVAPTPPAERPTTLYRSTAFMPKPNYQIKQAGIRRGLAEETREAQRYQKEPQVTETRPRDVETIKKITPNQNYPWDEERRTILPAATHTPDS